MALYTMLLFILAIAAILMSISAIMMAIAILLKLVQFAVWVFIKILELCIWCFDKDPAPLAEPGSTAHKEDLVLDLHHSEWKVID